MINFLSFFEWFNSFNFSLCVQYNNVQFFLLKNLWNSPKITTRTGHSIWFMWNLSSINAYKFTFVKYRFSFEMPQSNAKFYQCWFVVRKKLKLNSNQFNNKMQKKKTDEMAWRHFELNAKLNSRHSIWIGVCKTTE